MRPKAESLLSRSARRYPVTLDITRAGAEFHPLHEGLPGVLGRVLACAGRLALAGEWPRVKAGRNEPCHDAFADRTRNTSAAYCTPQCASQASIRAYRARKRASADETAETGN